MTCQGVITEKPKQHGDVRADVGSRHGAVLAAQGRLPEQREPGDANPMRKSWSTALPKPHGAHRRQPVDVARDRQHHIGR